jgi:hypothetical protein
MKNLLVIGGAGVLGRSIIKETASIARSTNVDRIKANNAHENITFEGSYKSLIGQLSKGPKFDMIACTAGGWKGGHVTDPDLLQTYSELNEIIVKPSLFACSAATTLLRERGMLVLIGANGVYKAPVPSMIAYSLCKSAVHALNSTYVGQDRISMATILFEALDTEGNRESLPPAQHNQLVPPQSVGQLIASWLQEQNVPRPGSFVRLRHEAGMLQQESFLP